ncbi:unnamed protein product [Protopolystoma xenopodis]|uniref:Uncharacterized protein n=1 Tax=Protopolystoma xenopodis TaxID=117903 RepID=A0A3S5FDH9_9PLAT|nr:unnamed protein product [Protopolystoma xenopodis]
MVSCSDDVRHMTDESSEWCEEDLLAQNQFLYSFRLGQLMNPSSNELKGITTYAFREVG